MRQCFLQLAAILAIPFAALYAALVPLSAQELRGSLLVSVVDFSGGAIPAAQVTLEEKNLATHREQTTDSRRDTPFPALSPPTYSVPLTPTAFPPQTPHILL